MEFIHGAFRTHNPNAFFLIRNSENIRKNIPDKYKDKFQDKDEISQTQIKKLKNHLSEFVSQEQIYTYDCFYNGLDSSTGRERVKKNFFFLFLNVDFYYLGENRWFT